MKCFIFCKHTRTSYTTSAIFADAFIFPQFLFQYSSPVFLHTCLTRFVFVGTEGKGAALLSHIDGLRALSALLPRTRLNIACSRVCGDWSWLGRKPRPRISLANSGAPPVRRYWTAQGHTAHFGTFPIHHCQIYTRETITSAHANCHTSALLIQYELHHTHTHMQILQ